MLTDHDPEPPTGSRKKCPTCDATPGGCQSLHTLGGRRCCATCSGDHDQPERTP